jgi:hypothetical protein
VPTSFPYTAPWTGPIDGITVDAAMLQAYVTDVINDLAAAQPVLQTGDVTITPSAPSTDTTEDVTFPDEFDTAPNVFLTANTSTVAAIVGLTASGISTTGFTIHFLNSASTTARNIQWFAIGG